MLFTLKKWKAWRSQYFALPESNKENKHLSLYYITTRCLRACVFVCHLFGPIWLNLFLLAPSWSQDGFRSKKFRIRDPDFPEIQKHPVFRVLFDRFGWKFQVILTLAQICFNTNKFLDRVSNFPDPESSIFPDKSGKNRQKSGLTVYHDVKHYFSYSNHGKFIFGTQFAIRRIFSNFLWIFFKIKVKIIKYRLLRCLEIAKWEDDYGNWMCKICKRVSP